LVKLKRIFALFPIFFACQFQVLYFFRTSPCNLLTPTWYSIVARLPGYLHLLALPMLHFAIMCERLRATLFSTFYEKEGISFSLMEMAIIVCILSRIILLKIFSF
jgi:hypothetical protein